METSEDQFKKALLHLERIFNNLNEHWHSIQLLLSHVSQPLKVDDRGLANVLSQIHINMRQFQQDLQNLDVVKTYSEIKFIGNRLHQIEKDISELKNDGVKRRVELEFVVDGYELVKKPKGYEKESMVEEDPNSYLTTLLETLNHRECQCLIHRYGLFNEKPKTFKDMEDVFKISRGRISQICAKALRKCRHPERRKFIDKITNTKLKKDILGE